MEMNPDDELPEWISWSDRIRGNNTTGKTEVWVPLYPDLAAVPLGKFVTQCTGFQ